MGAGEFMSKPITDVQSFDVFPPFWRSTTMVEESVLFVPPSPGHPAQAQLMFTPVDVPQLKSCTGEMTYEPGKDYLWSPGSRCLTQTAQSRISLLTDADLYPPRGSQKHGTCRDRNADLLFAETTEFHRVQTAVTYSHQLDGWQASWTPSPAYGLPRLSKRLQAGDPVRIVLLGDSISVGSNASGRYGVPPGNPGYGPLVAGAIERRFSSPVTFANLSVGGKDSGWGVEQMDAAVAAEPDLLIIAFGMNDASAKMPPDQFAANISRQIEILSEKRPDAECLLVAGMTGNPQWTGTQSELYPLYRDQLSQLQRPGVALADVLSVWEALISRKKYLDLTGNGLNHPNDFGHRVYAMVLLSVLHL